jgi:hypothetical protein
MQRLQQEMKIHAQCGEQDRLVDSDSAIIKSQATENVGTDVQYMSKHQTFSAFSAGLGAKKELGHVQGLIGTVLGRFPPTSSPFFLAKASGTTSGSVGSSALEISDAESVEIMFD